jgi:hypothetical protein
MQWKCAVCWYGQDKKDSEDRTIPNCCCSRTSSMQSNISIRPLLIFLMSQVFHSSGLTSARFTIQQSNTRYFLQCTTTCKIHVGIFNCIHSLERFRGFLGQIYKKDSSVSIKIKATYIYGELSCNVSKFQIRRSLL